MYRWDELREVRSGTSLGQKLAQGNLESFGEVRKRSQSRKDLAQFDRAHVRAREVGRSKLRLTQASGDTEGPDSFANANLQAAAGNPWACPRSSFPHLSACTGERIPPAVTQKEDGVAEDSGDGNQRFAPCPRRSRCRG
jgi:hypothetical protein